METKAKDGEGRELLHVGSIDENFCTKVLRRIRDNPGKEITLVLSSPGGSAQVAMAFYDTVRYVLKPKKFKIIGTGRLYSAAIPVFLAGTKRIVTKHTMMLFHQSRLPVPRETPNLTVSDLREVLGDMDEYEKFLAEIAEAETRGRLSAADVLKMKKSGAFISTKRALTLGLAHCVLE